MRESIDWDNVMVDRNDPNVGNFDGRKIIFIKKTDDMNSQQCGNCILEGHHDCNEFYGGSIKCDDVTKVWQYAPEVTEEPSVKPPEPATGRKFDSGKPMYSLLPTNALEEVVKVLTVGAVRYNEPIGQENWRLVPDADFRYYNATQRHIMAVKKGERLDLDKDGSKGTNCYHLACAITSLMFRLQTQIEEDIANGTYDENLWKKALN